MKKIFKYKEDGEIKTFTSEEFFKEIEKSEARREKYKIVKLWWELGRIKDKTWKFLRYDIKHGTRNLWRWRKVIWNDRDWDYHYLLSVIHFKLVEMEKLHRLHGSSVDSEKYAKEMQDAIDVLQRLIDDNYLLDYDGVEIWERQQADLNELSEILNKKLFGWWD